ncbi:hypothetical protein BDZ97DRAFT_2056945 [Flammula alnicola]|nr:hypothetical protein BDZ97DRAFT_2056945 [Flammula alnicola]
MSWARYYGHLGAKHGPDLRSTKHDHDWTESLTFLIGYLHSPSCRISIDGGYSNFGVLKGIVAGAELALKVAGAVGKAIPDAPSNLQAKTRWLQCTVKNQAQFNSSSWGMIPFRLRGYFKLLQRDNGILFGVSGGTIYRIVLDGNRNFDFAILSSNIFYRLDCILMGWTNPYARGNKSSITQGDTKAGYETADNRGKGHHFLFACLEGVVHAVNILQREMSKI